LNRWILKTDSDVYPFDQLERERQAVWDGVSNPVALKHIRSMAPGDPLLIYHSGSRKELVGLARVTSTPYPDPKHDDPKLTVVDIEVDRRLPRTVSLAAIKADPAFADLAIVRQPRLSVIPVPETQWKKLLAMGGLSS
jgi:predicted RNA-binding protein with PUA-like domain